MEFSRDPQNLTTPIIKNLKHLEVGKAKKTNIKNIDR
jgi:hypothetical protein